MNPGREKPYSSEICFLFCGAGASVPASVGRTRALRDQPMLSNSAVICASGAGVSRETSTITRLETRKAGSSS